MLRQTRLPKCLDEVGQRIRVDAFVSHDLGTEEPCHKSVCQVRPSQSLVVDSGSTVCEHEVHLDQLVKYLRDGEEHLRLKNSSKLAR